LSLGLVCWHADFIAVGEDEVHVLVKRKELAEKSTSVGYGYSETVVEELDYFTMAG
jgi:hypothetical protein